MPLLAKHPEFFDGRKVLVEATKWKFRDEEFELHLKTSHAVREGDHNESTFDDTSEESNNHSSCNPVAKRDFFLRPLALAAVAVVLAGVNTHHQILTVSGILLFALTTCLLVKSALSEKKFRQRIGDKKRKLLLEFAQGVCQICGSNSLALFVVSKFPFAEDTNPIGPDEEYACVCDACRRAVEWLVDTTPSPYAIKGSPEPKAA